MRSSPALRDRLAVLAFLGLWLGPVLWHGAVSQAPLPGDPLVLHRCHDIACLFTRRPATWNAYYVQVRRAGVPTWTTLELTPYFPMHPFGYRTRLHRFLIDWGPENQRGRDELAAWLFERHRQLHPDAPQPAELRFVWTWLAPQVDRPPTGAWHPPPVEKLAANRMRVLSVHRPEDR